VHDLTQTIVAVATPPGRGGVGCVRLSGPRAREIAARLFRPRRAGTSDEPGRTRFGRFFDRDRQPLDHGYAVRFASASSFTGEDVAELWPHGSPAVLTALVEGAIAHGAVAAGPGEFTYRAMRNGRVDLARGEAVRDLVDARTRYQARIALAQAEGALSRHLAPLREALADRIARGEAAVEFEDEPETQGPAGILGADVEAVRRTCVDLADGFRFGRIVREGARLVLVGRPNAGKSSLFNRLLVRERAIVTDVPGTTRDTLEESLDLDGIPVTLVDTAGLREATDPVEREGVERAERARRSADLVVLVLDGERDPDESERAALETAGRETDRTAIVVNKCDLPGVRERPLPTPEAILVSAVTGEGCGALRGRLSGLLRSGDAAAEDPIVTHARHAAALRAAAAALDRAAAAAGEGVPEDLVLEDLKEAMRELGGITGEFGTEDLYDRIFSTFCIGK